MIENLNKWLALTSAAISLAMVSGSADALVINNYFSPHLKSNSRASEIMWAINYSSAAFESSLSNDVSVNIYYDLDTTFNFYLGISGYAGDSFRKDVYLDALQDNAAAHPENKVLTQAIKDAGKGNFANQDLTYIGASSALLRANGFNVDGFLDKISTDLDLGGEELTGGIDGVVTLASIGEMLFGLDIPKYDGTPDSIRFSAINTLQHEIMHVLGGGNSNIGSDDQMEPLDLFRYSAPGKPNFGESGRVYFSLDGGMTEIQEFYSDPRKGGDPNGWGPLTPCPTGNGNGGPIGLFMDSISCSNQPTVTFNLSSPEGIQLMALGWNPRVTAVPEPATWTMMMLGFGGVGAALRRRQHRKPTVRASFA